jgi:hypothetical protein
VSDAAREVKLKVADVAGAKALALTAVDLLASPAALTKAREDLAAGGNHP